MVSQSMSALEGFPGSARVSPLRTFVRLRSVREDCFGETPKPTRGTRVLPSKLACMAWL